MGNAPFQGSRCAPARKGLPVDQPLATNEPLELDRPRPRLRPSARFKTKLSKSFNSFQLFDLTASTAKSVTKSSRKAQTEGAACESGCVLFARVFKH